jgi:hypothetical protein
MIVTLSNAPDISGRKYPDTGSTFCLLAEYIIHVGIQHSNGCEGVEMEMLHPPIFFRAVSFVELLHSSDAYGLLSSFLF